MPNLANLEELIKRFVPHRPGDPPTKNAEPQFAPGQAPTVMNGMPQLLQHLARQDQRITALEKELAELRGLVTPLHNR